MKHGNLANYLKLNYRKINIPKLIKRIVQGFHHLHTKGLLHGDVSVYNILMGKNFFHMSPQIFDMNFFEPKDSSIGLFANPEYLAPEIKIYSDYDVRAELWGIGVLIYQIVSNGRLPFGTRISKTTIEEIRNNAKAYKFVQGSPLISEFPEPFKTILGLLLVLDPENRAKSLVPVIKLL
jgi:serine/threonine protein kinase